MKRKRDRERDEATAREQAERRRETLLSDLRARLGSVPPPEEPEQPVEPEQPEPAQEPEPAEEPRPREEHDEPGPDDTGTA